MEQENSKALQRHEDCEQILESKARARVAGANQAAKQPRQTQQAHERDGGACFAAILLVLGRVLAVERGALAMLHDGVVQPAEYEGEGDDVDKHGEGKRGHEGSQKRSRVLNPAAILLLTGNDISNEQQNKSNNNNNNNNNNNKGNVQRAAAVNIDATSGKCDTDNNQRHH